MQEPMNSIVVILAGGQSQRMGGRDKGLVELNGRRLIDCVIERLKHQTDHILISAPHDYGTGLDHIPDAPDASKGPAGGVYSAYQWMLTHEPHAAGFYTAPVDAPFAPNDLIIRLGAGGGTAIVSDGENDHPTFAYWTAEALAAAWPALRGQPSVSLKKLADICAARRVVWPDVASFLNINTPEDLTAAAEIIRGQ